MCLHVVEVGNLALLVGNDGELDLGAGDILDVVDPALVGAEGVGRETDQLDAALLELGLKASHLTELGGADGGVVLGVGEEDDPVVANELVEVNGTLGGVSLEVGGDGAQAEAVSSGNQVSRTFIYPRAEKGASKQLMAKGSSNAEGLTERCGR